MMIDHPSWAPLTPGQKQPLGEERLEVKIGQNAWKSYFRKRKISCGKNYLWRKCYAAKIPATNFKWQNFTQHASKFNAAKIPFGEISCGAIKRGENFIWWNFLRLNFPRKIPYLLMKYFTITKIALFEIFKNHRKFNNYRIES